MTVFVLGESIQTQISNLVAQRVSRITFISYAQYRNIVNPNNMKVLCLFQRFFYWIMEMFIKLQAIFRMSSCKLRTPWPIHFKLRIVFGIDSLMICILFGEISIFHSRVMGKKVFTNIVRMLTTGVSCALGATVYLLLLELIDIFPALSKDLADH